MKERLFFAINFDDAIKKRLYQISLDFQKYNQPIKFENKDKLHLTLLFLGDVDVDSKKYELLLEKSLQISKKTQSTEIEFNSIGIFKDFRNPRVIWIGCKENEIIRKISDELKDSALRLGFKLDGKEFSPHITIGRVKGDLSKNFIDFIKSYSFISFKTKVESFELMESKLDRRGSKYYIKESYKLEE